MPHSPTTISYLSRSSVPSIALYLDFNLIKTSTPWIPLSVQPIRSCCFTPPLNPQPLTSTPLQITASLAASWVSSYFRGMVLCLSGESLRIEWMRTSVPLSGIPQKASEFIPSAPSILSQTLPSQWGPSWPLCSITSVSTHTHYPLIVFQFSSRH